MQSRSLTNGWQNYRPLERVIAELNLATLPDAAEELRAGIKELIVRETAAMTLQERSRSWMGYTPRSAGHWRRVAIWA